MSETAISFVNTVIVPMGLMAIMFSLGLSLGLGDFRRLLLRPRAALAGISGQILLLPVIGWALAWLFQLPPAMAVGVVILTACPGGVTSNAVVFAARADVALSVTLTAIASLITVLTTPFIINLGLDFFYGSAEAPSLDVLMTMKRLFQMTVLPVGLGMAVRALRSALADRLIVYLRPTSILILVLVIGFSVLISWELVVDNLIHVGPVVYLLNVLALCAGFGIARLTGLTRAETVTVALEIGIQNATMATFLSLSILNSWDLAIGPTIYGCIMLFNAALFVKFLNRTRS